MDMICPGSSDSAVQPRRVSRLAAAISQRQLVTAPSSSVTSR